MRKFFKGRSGNISREFFVSLSELLKTDRLMDFCGEAVLSCLTLIPKTPSMHKVNNTSAQKYKIVSSKLIIITDIHKNAFL